MKPSSRRRTLVLGGVGLTAAAAGAYWAARGGRSAAPPEPPWSLEFETPEGGTLRMSSLFGRPLVLNFWATWCPPCIEEMPQLDRFHADFGPRGWQVVGLAIDRKEPVNAFLAKRPVRFPTALAGVAGADLGRRLGNAAGALPFTAVFGADGRISHRKSGQTTYEELAGWAGPG